jgi:hypothetical protein
MPRRDALGWGVSLKTIQRARKEKQGSVAECLRLMKISESRRNVCTYSDHTYGDTLRSAQSREPAAQTDVQEVGFDGCWMALAPPRARDVVGCGRYSIGNGASPSRALVIGNYPRGVLALDSGEREGSGAKGRGFAYPTQIDPSCRKVEDRKLANSMICLGKVGRPSLRILNRVGVLKALLLRFGNQKIVGL